VSRLVLVGRRRGSRVFAACRDNEGLLDVRGQSLSRLPTVYESRAVAETMEKLVLRANEIPYTLHKL
jgi:hypothetical protein